MSKSHEIPDLFNAQGFLIDPDFWDRDLALRIAADLGLNDLEESHWAVIDYLRKHYLENASVPWEGNICRELNLSENCVHRLFGGPVKACKVAGLPHPGQEAPNDMPNGEPPDG